MLPDSSLIAALSGTTLLVSCGLLADFYRRRCRTLTDQLARDAQRAVAAAENGARYQAILEHAPIGCLVWEPGYRIVEWNRHAERMFGWRREEMVGQVFLPLLVPLNARMQFCRDAATLFAGGAAGPPTTLPMLTRAGGIVHCEWRHTALRNADGAPVRVVSLCTTLDDSHRRGIATILREQDKRYREVFENASDVLFVLAVADGRLVFDSINPAAEKAFGMPTAAMSDLCVADIVDGRLGAGTGGALQAHLPHFLAPLRTGLPAEFEGPLDLSPQRGADPPTFRVRLIPLADDSGIARLIAIGHDITSQRQREMEFRTLAENAPGVIVRYDAARRRTYVNAAFETLHRVPAASVLGKTLLEQSCVPPETARAMHGMLGAVLASGRPGELELDWQDPDGMARSYTLRAVPEFDDDGRIASVLTVAHDIGALKATERRLGHSQRQLHALLAHREDAREDERRRIARDLHEELGQLLTALRMDISTLPLQYGAALPALAERARTMTDLVDRTLKGMRDTVAALRPTVLDAGLAAGIEWLAEDSARHAGFACRVRLPAGNIALCEARATAAFRIVQEALTNAARHAAARQVDIVVAKEGDHWRIEVRDDGRGFDPAAPRADGFGLIGMHERATMLDGKLDIASALGQGTHITLHLPQRCRRNIPTAAQHRPTAKSSAPDSAHLPPRAC